MTAKTYRHYAFGIIVSLALAGWITTLSLSAVTSPTLPMGAAMGLAAATVMIGGPLAVLLLALWITYMIRDGGKIPGSVHVLLILPPLLAIPIYPVSQSMKRAEGSQFTNSHVSISEAHVNLSGEDLWIDARPYASIRSGGGPQMPLNARDSQRFMAFTRYPSSEFVNSGAFPYEDARMREDVDRYTYRLASGEAASSLPLSQMPYPDLMPFRPTSARDEASMLRYLYYHYPDHVDVAPALDPQFVTLVQDPYRTKLKGVVLFTVQNYASNAIARLEINGQALDIGDVALGPIPPLPAPCPHPHPAGAALTDLDKPISVRWQTLDEPIKWNEATLSVPSFREPNAIDGQWALLRVQLYFLPDGMTIESERSVQVQSSGNLLAIRATGVPSRVAAYARCGGAFDAQTMELLTD